MAWWSRLLERRSNPQWTLSELQSWGDMGLGSGPTASNHTVTPENALTVPAVFSCCQVLAQDLARTPIRLREKIGEDTFVDATAHPLFEILHALPNPEQGAFEVKAALMWSLLTYGRAYAEIVRVNGRVTALWPLDSRRMRVDRTPARVKRWTYSTGSSTHVWLFDPSQPPIFELVHDTPLARCRELVGTALALQEYVGKFFANGARPSGVLTAAGRLTPDQKTSLKEQWRGLFASGGSNVRGVPVVDGGLKFETIASENDSAQLVETMAQLTTQICGVFRVPAWKAGNLDKTSYSNMESSALDYVTSTLDPLFQLWEDAMRRDLLTSRQYNQYTIQFDRSALLRSDMQALHASLAVGRNTGFYSANDCRRKLGENPIPNGDDYLVNSALQPAGAPHAPAIT
jgi:HK97 family phage portal protein